MSDTDQSMVVQFAIHSDDECDECGREHVDVVLLGDVSCGNEPAAVCLDCIRLAEKALEEYE